MKSVPVKSVVICEKPSQAANVRAAVGDSYGVVLAAQGHLLRLEAPDEVNPAWTRWTNEVLVPPAGRYGYRPDDGGGKAQRLAAITAALATADQVIIATDCDREGQAIGESLIEYLGFEGEVRRAMFTAEDVRTLKDAFANAKPCSAYRPLYDAAVARQQVDQIYNLTLTRVATNVLRPAGQKGALGVGRVKTPTLGIVCTRELEITGFTPRAFHEIAVTVEGPGGRVELWHRPRGHTRVFDATTAKAFAEAASRSKGPLSIVRESKRAVPPKPFDLPSLQKWAGRLGWTAKRVLDTAQALYETHKLISYPRAETRYLPEALAVQAPGLLAALMTIPHLAIAAPADAVIRTGKGEVYTDRGVAGASHHAIIPNVNMADRFAALIPMLTADERTLFDVIARGWLACVSPDHQFDETVMTLAVIVDGQPVAFTLKGKVETAAGWKVTLSDADDTDADNTNDAANEVALLPAWLDGQTVTVSGTRVVAKTTTPPERYTEGDLIDAMKNAWRFVADPIEQDRLKAAKGIGTPATRDTVIEGLKSQGMVALKKGRLHPTDVGLWLFTTLRHAAPELVDPGATARMEHNLDAVLDGSATVDAVMGDAIARTMAIVERIVAGGAPTAPAVAREPTAGMLVAARAKAKRDGLKRLPNGVADSFDACRAYLGPLPERPAGASDATVRLASEKQLAVITSFVTKGAAPPDGYPAAVTLQSARAFLDRALAKR